MYLHCVHTHILDTKETQHFGLDYLYRTFLFVVGNNALFRVCPQEMISKLKLVPDDHVRIMRDIK